MNLRFLKYLCLLVLIPHVVQAEDLLKTAAKQAIVVDYQTGAVLFEKNPDERMPTSSMSKVMTMYLVFDALKKNALTLEDKLLVSEKAWRKGGSKMFVEVDKKIKVEDLIRGVIVQSGNDATIVLAEGIAGTEETFAERLTEKAHEIGMANSNFKNASGWPDPDHYSTARDLALMAHSLITEFPEYYSYYSEQEFKYNNINQRNRNPLLYRNIGADGIKTGHTEAGGYGLIGSGKQGDRRVILVVNGLKDEKERAQESARLLDWGLNRFINHTLFSADEIVESARVVMGKKEIVPVVTNEDLLVSIPKIAKKDIKVTANFTEPLLAPIRKGAEVGVLRIEIPDMQPVEHPLYAAEAIESLGFFSTGLAKAKLFFSNKNTATQ